MKVRKVFAGSDDVYGAPRVHAQLTREGTGVDRKTVAKSMLRKGLEGISPKTFSTATTLSGVQPHTIPGRARRRWDQGRIDRCWISDITNLRTGEGWVYLAAVTDGHSRRIIGWAMNTHMHTELVERTLHMAHTLCGDLPSDVVFHADRGCQFTSEQMQRVCQDLHLQQSMGRTGVCWDNAMTSECVVDAKDFSSTTGTPGRPGQRLDRLWSAGLRWSTTVDGCTRRWGMCRW